MKKFLLTKRTPLALFRRTVCVLILILGFSGNANAQCPAPYQVYESFLRSGLGAGNNDLVTKGWTTSATNISVANSAAGARSGTQHFQFNPTVGGFIQTPLLVDPDKLQFFFRSSSTTLNTNLVVEWSFTSNFASTIGSIPIVTTGATYISSPIIDLSTLSNIYVRVRSVSFVTTSAATFLDDFTWTSRTAANNRIIVPSTVAAAATSTCNPVNVPAAGTGTYSFYDQGGLSDTYNKSQTQIVHFAPSVAGEKVKITFNSFAIDAFGGTNITVYNGNGTTAGTEFAGLNAATAVTAGTSVTSTDGSGYITVRYVTTGSLTALTTAAHTGFNTTVECVSNPTITSLTGSGCVGGTLVIAGSNLGGATAVTIGGVAVSAIGANTSTSLTVTPAPGSSGTVAVTTAAGSVTSSATYASNFLPTVSTPPSTSTQTICINDPAAPLSVTAAAGSGNIATYQWYSNTSASTAGATLVATNTSSATTDTYTPLTNSAGTLFYYVVVTNSNGCSVTSAFSGGITVNASVVITTQPSLTTQTVCVGASITPLSVVATGGGLSYQWFSNSANSNVGGDLIGGAVLSTYTPPNTSAMATTFYYCVVTNGAPCNSSVPSAASGGILVNPLPTAVTVSTAGTYCTNTTLTSANGGSGTIYYQGTTSGGTSTTTLATSQLVTASGTYYFRARSASGCWGPEGSAAVTILSVPVAPVAAAATAVGTSGFTANWAAASGATGYSIDVSTVNTFASFVTGYSNLTLGNVLTTTISGLTPGVTYFYRVRGFNSCGPSDVSNTITAITTAISYCTPSGATFAQDPLGITNFTLGTINNSTGLEANNYGNYSSISTSAFIGVTLPFSITFRTGFSYDTNIWIDWNNDGDFTDAGELVYNGASLSSVPTTLSGTFAIPLLNSDGTSTLGPHRLRIGSIDGPGFTGGALTPCRTGAYQAFEDYTLTVIPVPACAVTTPSVLTTESVTGTSATLVWTDPGMTPNSVYNYFVSTSNVAPPNTSSDPVGMGTVTGALTANVTGLTIGVTYYFWVRVKCNASNFSNWVGSANFITANLDVINMTTGSSTTCNAKFYDSGGFGGDYTDSQNFTYTISPDPGKSLKVVFNSFNTENNYDGLVIYNGPNTGSPIIPSGLPVGTNATTAPANSFYGSTSPGTIITPVDGSLTFQFRSDGSVFLAGWDATVTCVTLPTITTFGPASTCVGTTPLVTLTGTNFTGVTSVTFNGLNAPSFSVVDNTTITVTVPAGATTGVISVANANASSVSNTSFIVNPIPATPNAGSDVVICSGQTTTLNATSTPTSNSLVTSLLGGNGCTNGNMFNITTGLSSVTITAFDITPNVTAVQNVAVYYRVGTYVGNETNAGAWTLLGTYNVNGVDKVLINMPVANLLIPASSTYGIYINYNAAYSNGTNTYSNSEITINTGVGLCSSFGTVSASRTFNGRVYYQGNLPLTYNWTPATGLSATTIFNPVASPTSSQTYLVSATLNGCTSPTDAVVVTVNPKPTVTIPTAGGNICANAVVPVTSTGTASAFTWTSTVANTLFTDATASTPYILGSNATAIFVRTPTTATITVTATNTPSGCQETATVIFTVSTKTFNSGFWSPGGAPLNNGTENLVFNSGSFNSTGNLSACSCSVTGANVTFNSGHTLSLLNGLTVSSGSMTFNSGASLVQTNNVTNTGNIVYRRDSTPSFRFDYTYWSSPVASQTLTGLSPATGSQGFFDYNPLISNWQQSNNTLAMVLGKGYLIRVPNTFPLSNGFNTPINFNANFTGVPNNGNIPVSIVHNPANELNLIGNPYPSAISATALVTDPGFSVNTSFLGGTIYLWSHNTALNLVTNQYLSSDYAVWSVLGGTNTFYSGNIGAANSNPPTGSIASGQGFFIKTIASGTAFFRNSMRLIGNNASNFYKNSSGSAASDTTADPFNTFEKHRIWLSINNANTAYKQILLGYIETGTDGLDRLFDGEMVDNNNQVTLYTTVEDTKLSIQGRGLTFTQNDTYAIGYKSLVADNYTLNLSNFDGLFESQNIYIEDTLLNVIHDLKLGTYSFASEAGTFENRFVLRFTNTTLGLPTFSENTVIVYKNEEGLQVNTGVVPMNSVAIYDVAGRLISEQNDLNSIQTKFTTLPKTNQVLLVKITAETGEKLTKKVVY